jgi:hypothetical protein
MLRRRWTLAVVKLLAIKRPAYCAGSSIKRCDVTNGDTRDAQWLLTHAPAYRRHYSDNAAVTRAFTDGVLAAVQGLQAAGLSPEQERAVLLQISARTGEKLLPSD